MGARVSRRDVLAAACAFAFAAPLGARAGRKTVLNAGAVQYGTGQWLFDVIAHNKLGAAEGFNLSLRLLASNRTAPALRRRSRCCVTRFGIPPAPARLSVA